jgi:hypothetical protein
VLLSEMTEKAIDYIFEHIEHDPLSKWEAGFVMSVADQWHRSRRLSDKQKEILGQIWDKQS